MLQFREHQANCATEPNGSQTNLISDLLFEKYMMRRAARRWRMRYGSGST